MSKCPTKTKQNYILHKIPNQTKFVKKKQHGSTYLRIKPAHRERTEFQGPQITTKGSTRDNLRKVFSCNNLKNKEETTNNCCFESE